MSEWFEAPPWGRQVLAAVAISALLAVAHDDMRSRPQPVQYTQFKVAALLASGHIETQKICAPIGTEFYLRYIHSWPGDRTRSASQLPGVEYKAPRIPESQYFGGTMMENMIPIKVDYENENIGCLPKK